MGGVTHASQVCRVIPQSACPAAVSRSGWQRLLSRLPCASSSTIRRSYLGRAPSSSWATETRVPPPPQPPTRRPRALSPQPRAYPQSLSTPFAASFRRKFGQRWRVSRGPRQRCPLPQPPAQAPRPPPAVSDMFIPRSAARSPSHSGRAAHPDKDTQAGQYARMYCLPQLCPTSSTPKSSSLV